MAGLLRKRSEYFKDTGVCPFHDVTNEETGS